jgi:hypothetical protein
MLELSPLRKNKVNLSDYNSQQDIENRMMLADFTIFEHRVLEEILFSSLKLSFKKFCKSIDSLDQDVLPVLEKLAAAGLLSIDGDNLLVDKEMRKYFEFQIARFDEEFKPDMEFLQGLLRKVPIHVLPTWYSIPRTSSNIFESILEKHLLSPQIFIRYLSELHLNNTKLGAIVQDVHGTAPFQVASSDLIAKYNLSRREFEEIMLWLEFNFICCLSYKKEDDYWIEWVSPFYEWRQYLLFLEETIPFPIVSKDVIANRETDFAFVEDLTKLLQKAEKNPIDLTSWDSSSLFDEDITRTLSSLIELRPLTEISFAQKYLTQAIKKLCLVHLAHLEKGRLYCNESAKDWLNLSLENKASYLHRHPLNHIISFSIPASLNTEKYIHEAEKAIKRVAHDGWVYVDDFMKGVVTSFDEHSTITLKKTGKTWRYTLPQYSEEQKLLLKATLFEWLFEAGMVSLGVLGGRNCFRVTAFGRCFF